MKNTNPIEKKIPKKNRRIPLKDHSRLLADFFNGIVLETEEEYII